VLVPEALAHASITGVSPVVGPSLAAVPHRRGPLRGPRPRRPASEKLEELKALWFEEAKANNVLPLNDMDVIGNPQDLETFMGLEFNAPVPPGGQYTSRFGSHALIVKVVFDDAYIDVERHFAAAMARD
jgi:hypothetical protein